jgi:hypothetical protein
MNWEDKLLDLLVEAMSPGAKSTLKHHRTMRAVDKKIYTDAGVMSKDQIKSAEHEKAQAEKRKHAAIGTIPGADKPAKHVDTAGTRGRETRLHQYVKDRVYSAKLSDQGVRASDLASNLASNAGNKKLARRWKSIGRIHQGRAVASLKKLAAVGGEGEMDPHDKRMVRRGHTQPRRELN